MTQPNGIDLEQYRTQAKDLLKLARSGHPESIDRIRRSHPEPESALQPDRLRLADAQLVIARENGYQSWPRLKDDLLFRKAVLLLDTGNVPALADLLDRNPRLLIYRCKTGDWYESGYFAHAMLLHHVAGNPIRRPPPPNIVEATRLLLDRGADPNARTLAGESTIRLLLTSKQASEARVAVPLVDLLRARGARDVVSDEQALTWSLLDAAPDTAADLVQRGAKMDVRHAAGLGRLEALQSLLAEGPPLEKVEEALYFAAVRGRPESVPPLLRHGARGDVLISIGGRTPRTALHESANRGHEEIVRLLLESGADPTVIEPNWGGTPSGWARHGGHTELAALLDQHAAG